MLGVLLRGRAVRRAGLDSIMSPSVTTSSPKPPSTDFNCTRVPVPTALGPSKCSAQLWYQEGSGGEKKYRGTGREVRWTSGSSSPLSHTAAPPSLAPLYRTSSSSCGEEEEEENVDGAGWISSPAVWWRGLLGVPHRRPGLGGAAGQISARSPRGREAAPPAG